jgi:hypothetical protein
MSQLRTWQRHHAERVVAEVCPVPGMGTWEACARLLGPPETERQVGLQFSLLTDAQDAADVLARAMMPHECDAMCEPWSAIERRRIPR